MQIGRMNYKSSCNINSLRGIRVGYSRHSSKSTLFLEHSWKGRCIKSFCAQVEPDSEQVRHETEDEQYERRVRESMEVNERVVDIFDINDLQEALTEAEDKLVVIEIESETTCDTGIVEEKEVEWSFEIQERLDRCKGIKHTFQRTARECQDVVFLSIQIDKLTKELKEVTDYLQIEYIPSLLFIKNRKILWKHEGILALQNNLGEGVLYYGDLAAEGERASQYVTELQSAEDVDKFIAEGTDNELAVINVSSTNCIPCVKIFPAVLALAKNMGGAVRFARLMADESKDKADAATRLKVRDAPTFLFCKGGRVVDRHIGSSRGDLIGHLLKVALAQKVDLPTPDAPGKKRLSAMQ